MYTNISKDKNHKYDIQNSTKVTLMAELRLALASAEYKLIIRKELGDFTLDGRGSTNAAPEFDGYPPFQRQLQS